MMTSFCVQRGLSLVYKIRYCRARLAFMSSARFNLAYKVKS